MLKQIQYCIRKNPETGWFRDFCKHLGYTIVANCVNWWKFTKLPGSQFPMNSRGEKRCVVTMKTGKEFVMQFSVYAVCNSF